MAKVTSRFGPFKPDLPTLGSDGSDVVTNAIPGQNGYRPVKGLEPFTDAVNDRVLASVFVISSAGAVSGFAATRTDLFQVELESFDNVTRNGGEAYNTASDGVWDFELFEDQVFASNFDDAIQVFDLGGSTDFSERGISPKARYMMVINGFLFLLNINEDGRVRPTGVRWSSRDDPLSFPEPGTTEAVQTLSDRRILASRYGEITGGESGLVSADAVIFQEEAVTSVNFIGGRRTFSFNVIEGARGCNSPGSIIQVGGLVFYLDNAGFYVTDGTSSTPIGNKLIDEFFYKNVSADSLKDVRGGDDLRLKIVYWNVQDVNGDRFTLVYNYDIAEWGFLDNLFQVQVFTQSLNPGFTFDDLQRLSDTLDGLPASLDSDLFKGGGIPIFSAFDNQNRLSTFTGPNLPATLRTPEVELIEDARAYVQFSRALIDTNDFTVAPVTRDDLADERIVGAPRQKGPGGTCLHRKTARYWGLEIKVGDGADWNFAQGLQVIYEQGGRRQPTIPIENADLVEQLLLASNDCAVLTDEGRRIELVVIEEVAEAFFLVTFDLENLITFTGDKLTGFDGAS